MDKYDCLNQLRDEAYHIAKSKGWEEPPATVGEFLALIHSEVSEALEEYRNGHAPNEVYYNVDKPDKPEGVAAELADVLIRVFHFAGKHDIDLAAIVERKTLYNMSRPHRHGGKRL